MNVEKKKIEVMLILFVAIFLVAYKFLILPFTSIWMDLIVLVLIGIIYVAYRLMKK